MGERANGGESPRSLSERRRSWRGRAAEAGLRRRRRSPRAATPTRHLHCAARARSLRARRAGFQQPPAHRAAAWVLLLGARLFSYLPSPLCGARVVPLGPPRRLAATSRVRFGDGRGTCPTVQGLRQAGPSPRGELRGDVSLPLAFLLCYGGAILQAHSYHPSWDKQE
jgi:hypothetical protein